MGGQLGRGIEKIGAAISETGDRIQKANEQAEMSEIGAKMAQAQADLTIELQEKVKAGEINKDENGKYTFTDDFKARVQEKFEEIGGGITTRKAQLAFQEDSARAVSRFTVHAFEAESQLVGRKSRLDYEQAFGARTSELLNNPSAFKDKLAENDQDIDRRFQTGQISAELADDLKFKSRKGLAKAYVEGWAKLSPEDAKVILDKGEVDQFVDGDLKYELYAKINAQDRAARAEANLVKQQEKEARRERANELMDKAFVDLSRGKTAGLKDRILDTEDLDWKEKQRFIDYMEMKSTQKLKTDRGTYLSLFSRIHADESDPNRITSDMELLDYARMGLLDDRALNSLRRELRGSGTEAGRNEAQLKKAFLKDIEAKLVKKDAFGTVDPQGQESYTKFIAAFQEAFANAKDEGKLPRDLLTPGSPDYLGALANPYMKSPQDRIRDQIKSMRPAPAVTPAPTATPVPKKPGESPADYLKRIGK
jgi:hypothetical protein